MDEDPTLKEQAELMLRWIDDPSIQIQAKYAGKTAQWIDCKDPHWKLDRFYYREKPREPRHFWVNAYGNARQDLHIHATFSEAQRWACQTMKECIHVVEVFDD